MCYGVTLSILMDGIGALLVHLSACSHKLGLPFYKTILCLIYSSRNLGLITLGLPQVIVGLPTGNLIGDGVRRYTPLTWLHTGTQTPNRI